MGNRALVLFCVLVYALSWSLQCAALLFFPDPESPGAAPYLLAGMAAPAVVTLLFAAFSAETRKRVLWKPTWRMIPLLATAVIVPTLIAFAVVGSVEALGWGKSGWFIFSARGVQISGGPWLLGRGSQNWTLFVANVLATGGAYAAFNAIPAFGEELGWRGFLQGALIEKLGAVRGVALLGLIWSFFHLPLLLRGYNFPGHPLLGAFVLFPLELMAISFFLAWLTLRSGTVLPAAIAHGATNSIEEGVISNLHLAVPHLVLDLLRGGMTVAVGLFFLLLLKLFRDRRSAPSPTSRQDGAGPAPSINLPIASR